MRERSPQFSLKSPYQKTNLLNYCFVYSWRKRHKNNPKKIAYLFVEFVRLRGRSLSTPLSLCCLWKSSSLSRLSTLSGGFRSRLLFRTVGGELSELRSLRGVDTSSPESFASEAFLGLLGDTGDEGPGEVTGDGTGDPQMREYLGEHVEKLLNSFEKLLNSSSSSSSSSVSNS